MTDTELREKVVSLTWCAEAGEMAINPDEFMALIDAERRRFAREELEKILDPEVPMTFDDLKYSRGILLSRRICQAIAALRQEGGK